MGGFAGGHDKVNRYNYEKQYTAAAIFCCVVASSGGLLFGYDLGVAGGVSSQEDFLKTFLHSVWEAKDGPHKFKATSPYCKFDSQILSLFQSSMYLAAFLASFAAAYVAKLRGRKMCMILAGLAYIIGVALTTGAVYKSSGIIMLVLGRCALGVGVGFGNASVTIYAGEMAPPKYRGALILLFQWCVTIGMIVAQLINYGVEGMERNGWRISLAIAGVPAVIIFAGGIFLPESPSSLIARDYHEEGRKIKFKTSALGCDLPSTWALKANSLTESGLKVLQKIRGQEDVSMEFDDILLSTRQDKLIRHPIAALYKPCYLPFTILSTIVCIIHEMSGSNAVMFYAPQLFALMGHSHKSSLMQTVIIGAVKVGATLVAIFSVDRFGRRNLLICSSVFMIATLCIIGGISSHYLTTQHTKLPDNVGNVVLAMICLFCANYAWSWGPLGWLVPAEVQPLEIRAAGMANANAINMFFAFMIGQTFLKQLCSMKFGVLFFFAGVCFVGLLFTFFFLPECKGLHIEKVHEAFAKHWFCSKFPSPPRELLPCLDNKTIERDVSITDEKKPEVHTVHD